MAARDMDKLQEIDKFYSSLGTVPALIGELAMSVAAAQARLDRNYVDSFTRFVEVVAGPGKAERRRVPGPLECINWPTLFAQQRLDLL